MDDSDDPLAGPSDRAKQLRFLDQVIDPRLGTKGRLGYLCNRVDAQDVASELIERAEDGTWAAVIQSAIRRCPDSEFDHHDPNCGICGTALWPEHIPIEHLNDVRKRLRNDRLFALVYLAQASGEGAVFPQSEVERVYDSDRIVGHVPPDMKVVCGLDPASVGGAGVFALAFDPATGRTWLVDADWSTNRHTRGLHQWVREYVNRYRPVAFGIDAQGGNALFAEDEELGRFLQDNQCQLIALPTGRNKRDPEYGIPSLRNYFDAYDRKFSIPWGDYYSQQKMRHFVNQLTGYFPGTQGAYDLVMSWWYAVRAMQQHLPRARISSLPMDPLFSKRPYLRVVRNERIRVG